MSLHMAPSNHQPLVPLTISKVAFLTSSLETIFSISLSPAPLAPADHSVHSCRQDPSAHSPGPPRKRPHVPIRMRHQMTAASLQPLLLPGEPAPGDRLQTILKTAEIAHEWGPFKMLTWHCGPGKSHLVARWRHTVAAS